MGHERRRTAEHDPAPADVAAVLRERIYGGIACLSTLLVLVRHLEEDHTTAWGAFADVAVATGGLWAASLFADALAHLAAHGRGFDRPQAIRAVRASGQIVQASVVPLVLLVIAALDGMRVQAALRAGVWVSVISLGLFASLAVRRTSLPWWQRLLAVAVLVALGAGVVTIKMLAH